MRNLNWVQYAVSFSKTLLGILAHRNVESRFCQKLKFWPPGFQKQLRWSSQNLYSKHFYGCCWHFNQNMTVLFLLVLRFRSSNFGQLQWGKRKAIFLLKTMFHPSVCQSKSNAHPNICNFQLLCYSCSSWQILVVSACAQLEIFVVKVGSTCENKTDLDERRIFHHKLSKKLSEAHKKIFLFSKYHCTTLTVELELNVSVCAHL